MRATLLSADPEEAKIPWSTISRNPFVSLQSQGWPLTTNPTTPELEEWFMQCWRSNPELCTTQVLSLPAHLQPAFIQPLESGLFPLTNRFESCAQGYRYQVYCFELLMRFLGNHNWLIIYKGIGIWKLASLEPSKVCSPFLKPERK